ncbi:endonuclease/exonuclease/phosphatase family protein [Flavihumibacter fluvii]|uniref:endonuclease/exonuclease/phosphatase family protein n=1 Tax=Flavihumibacter fluvii TaxID=2838157 RepID=UPI001BDEB960|nr:endonuclease/exonuclease/phosphatase family protein [Flavihumibacter fluvii]ULQ50617.1 endonuclease/exonuclease/phosphatase family protein [Flavihumibacter fluvii]
MSYNMRYDNPDDGENRWEIRRESLAGLLQFHAPDFIGTQELLDHQLEFILSKLPDYGKVGVARIDGKKKGEYACILFNSRSFKVIEQHDFWLSQYPDSIGLRGWDADQERICSYGLFEDRKSRQRFWVFNTHFDHIGAEARLQSARLIWQKMTEINAQKKLPVFLMGDFNSRPNEAPAQYLSEKMNNARTNSALVYGPEKTFNDFNFSAPLKSCIDYIFTSKDPRITIRKFATLTDSYDMKYPSDHLPVIADILIQQK